MVPKSIVSPRFIGTQENTAPKIFWLFFEPKRLVQLQYFTNLNSGARKQ